MLSLLQTEQLMKLSKLGMDCKAHVMESDAEVIDHLLYVHA